MEDVEELLQIQAKGIEKCQGLALASAERQAIQDEAIANFRAEIAENHTKMETKFNEWFDNLEGEQLRLQKEIQAQSGKHDETISEMHSFKKFIHK